jgi:hypothetical protein
MPQASTSIPQQTAPVIARHIAANVAVEFSSMAIARRLDRAAMGARAGSVAELTYRLDLLRDNLTHQEDASDWTLALLDAIRRDVAHLAATPATPRAIGVQ